MKKQFVDMIYRMNKWKKKMLCLLLNGISYHFETINNLSEVDLYFNIDAMGEYTWRCCYDMTHERIPKIDLTEDQYALEYMAYQTTKFGVELSEPTINKHITVTPSYNSWYGF